jgi:hypothetical protein
MSGADSNETAHPDLVICHGCAFEWPKVLRFSGGRRRPTKALGS